MELAGGEAFLGGAVAGGTEGVEEAWGEVDFAGEESARGLLATAVESKAVVCLEISNYAVRKEKEKKAATGAGAPVAGMSQIIY